MNSEALETIGTVTLICLAALGLLTLFSLPLMFFESSNEVRHRDPSVYTDQVYKYEPDEETVCYIFGSNGPGGVSCIVKNIKE